MLRDWRIGCSIHLGFRYSRSIAEPAPLAVFASVTIPSGFVKALYMNAAGEVKVNTVFAPAQTWSQKPG